MTVASFQAAGYAVLIKDEPKQKHTSTRKTNAPVAYRSKTFIPSQIKMSIYAKKFFKILLSTNTIWTIFGGATKTTIIMTDCKSIRKFFRTKMIPPPFWNSCDFVLQFNFVITHIPVKMNTATDFPSRHESDTQEKTVLKIREDITVKPSEVDIETTGIAREEPVLNKDNDLTEFPEKENWQTTFAIPHPVNFCSQQLRPTITLTHPKNHQS